MNKYKKILAIASLLSFSLILNTAIAAWSVPAGAPPDYNTSAPINISATPQTKAGSFESSTSIKTPQLCLGSDCRNAWPSGSGTNYWTSNGAGALFNNTDTTVGINTNNPYTGSALWVNASGKGYGLYTYGANYGVIGSGSTGVYGSGGYVGLYGYGQTASIQLQDYVNWGSATYGTQNKVGNKILGSKTTDGIAQWYTPTELGLSSGGTSGVTNITGNGGVSVSPSTGSVSVSLSGTDAYGAMCTNGQILKKNASNYWTCSTDNTSSGGITGSGTGWTLPVFGGSAGVSGQTSLANSPITMSSASGEATLMRVNMFPSSLWGTKTNIALDINGRIKIADGTQNTNKILVSTDTTGAANWKYPSEIGISSGSSLGWVTIDSGGIANAWGQYGNYVYYTDGGNHRPSYMCQKNGYTYFVGACKFIYAGKYYEGTVTANQYFLPNNNWAISCNYGLNGYGFTADGQSQILCGK